MSKKPSRTILHRIAWGLFSLSCVLSACTAPASLPASPPPLVSKLRVVMDNNYPPYIFRNEQGALQGILIDQWALWEQRTGVEVEITALPWGEALESMKAGEFDVIDTIFYTDERAQIFDFTEPYASIDVSIFFHHNISGIVDAGDLKGFQVAVKRGDANVEYLINQGITDLVYYDSYEQIIQAAARQEEVIFVIDQPPAWYYLYKNKIQDQFNQSAPLYGGAFHRAVKKGDAALLNLVIDGFSKISQAEYRVIGERWFGKPQSSSLAALSPYLGLGMGLAALVIFLLVVFGFALQSQVKKRTAELQTALDNLRQSEQAARDSETRFRLVSELTTDYIFKVEVEADGKLKMAFVTENYETITGRPPAEAVSSDMWRKIIHPNDWEAFQQAIGSALGGQKVAREFRTFTHKPVPGSLPSEDSSEHERWVLVFARPEWDEAQQRVIAIVGAVKDITKRKRAEEALRQLNAELELRVVERTKELESFTYSVSHDLRAPLRAINGYARILQEDYAHLLTPEALPLFQNVRDQSSYMGKLIDALLNLARLSRAEMRTETVDLGLLTRVSAHELQQSQPERQVEWVIAEPLLVQGDPQLLHIVMENLLSNAWKFTSQRQQARIEVGAQNSASSAQSSASSAGSAPLAEDKTVYFVRDNGIGFDMAYADRLFNAFQRLHTAQGFEGAGVGLTTVQRIIQRHDGRVWAEAEEGVGATFYFTL